MQKMIVLGGVGSRFRISAVITRWIHCGQCEMVE